MGQDHPITLYNTRTRQKEPFAPIDDKNVRLYVCGPTVYDYAHIGNARPIIVFDVLFRLLRHVYGPDHVTYVRNITDIDDKINARAAEEGVPIGDVTARTTGQFHSDIAALGVLEPTHEPRATDHVAGMVQMIEKLVEGGHAYAAEGHVLFEVGTMPDYGLLSKRSLDDMRAGARVEVAPYKRDPMDFVLWKPSSDDEPGWDSPWGRGRPGWHIECSAMAKRYLGEVFDIHGGGIDLVFPHHENEIAQSRCAHGTDVMANVWMHNGFLQVEGQKMSKSLGNFVTIQELLETEKFGGRKWPGEVLRLAMLMTHYRKPIDWTVNRLEEAKSISLSFANITRRYAPDEGTVLPEVLDALGDDLDTVAAIRVIQQSAANPVDLAASVYFLGLEDHRIAEIAAKRRDEQRYGIRNAVENAFDSLLLEKIGLIESDLDQHIASRLDFIREKNWAEADRIRDELLAQGIQLKDSKDPDTGERMTTWEVVR